MTLAADIITYISNHTDTSVYDALTGGLYDWNATNGVTGITYDNEPNAFTISNNIPLLNPLMIVRTNAVDPTHYITDPVSRKQSGKHLIQMFLYEHQAYNVITQVANDLYDMFHEQVIIDFKANTKYIGGNHRRNAIDISGAMFIRLDFLFEGLIQTIM